METPYCHAGPGGELYASKGNGSFRNLRLYLDVFACNLRVWTHDAANPRFRPNPILYPNVCEKNILPTEMIE